MRFRRLCIPCLLVAISFSEVAGTQSTPAQAPSPPQAHTLAQSPGAVTITLEDAIQMALRHNHNLLAARTTIQQSQAEETTANLRPNPVLLGDSQFLPIFQPSQFTSDYLDNTAQFDLGVSYLFERGKKRQHRLQAAKDQTAVTRSQVADNERSLTFSVASQFINVELAESTLELANEDLRASRTRWTSARRAIRQATSAKTICSRSSFSCFNSRPTSPQRASPGFRDSPTCGSCSDTNR